LNKSNMWPEKLKDDHYQDDSHQEQGLGRLK
jgi:hypothetical protein